MLAARESYGVRCSVMKMRRMGRMLSTAAAVRRTTENKIRSSLQPSMRAAST